MVVKVPIALGGTGADNAADARANLGVSGNTSGGVYSGIAISNAQITSSNVSGNVTVLTGNVMLTKAGANVTFEAPGSTVVGAQFKTPSMHDLATQRVITLKSNNYSGNRSGDYLVPTMNIKAKYNNVSINTTGRILYANRFDDETLMPDTAKYEGFVAYDRNPGGTGELYFSNADSRQKLYNANADLTPAQNSYFNLGTAAKVFKELHLGANARVLGNVHVDKGLIVGTDDFIVKYRNPTQQMKIGINTNDPQHEVDIRANVYISGNLTVKGNVYAVDTTHLIIDDPVIELGANTVGTPTLDTGVLMNRGNLANAFMGFDESQNEFVMGLTSDPSSVTTITLSSYAPLQVGPLYTNYSANIAGNASVTRSLAVGFTDGRIPRANLEVKGNTYISGATTIAGATILSSTADISGKLSATSQTPSFYGANVTGNVSVTRSLAVGYTDQRVPQANLDVKGNTYISGTVTLGTVLGITSGGTGATSLTDGGVLLGSGTSAITVTPVLTDGVMIVGDGTTDPVLEGNTTLRTSIGVGTGDTPQFYGANVSGNASINRSLAVGYTDGRVPQANLDVRNNVYIGGATTIAGAATLSSTVDISGKLSSTNQTPAFYGANVTGNVSVTRGLSIGWADGRVPQANLEVAGNANVGILTATSLRINGTPVSTTSTFLGLTDTPSSYSSQSGKLAAVNSAENAIEFIEDNAVVMAIALG